MRLMFFLVSSNFPIAYKCIHYICKTVYKHKYIKMYLKPYIIFNDVFGFSVYYCYES